MNKLVNISLISNITLEPYFSQIISEIFSNIKKTIAISHIYFENGISEYNLHQLRKSDYILVIMNFNNMFPDACNLLSDKLPIINDVKKTTLQRANQLYSKIKEYTPNPILWFGFEDYCFNYSEIFGNIPICNNVVDLLNMQLSSMLTFHKDIYIDLKRTIATVGIDKAYNYRNYYRWNSPYSKELLKKAGAEIYKQYLIHNGITKKCIILDCDNVIWGGILSDDGIEGIKISNSGLGRSFQDFQRFVVNMYYHGVILAICSKNDENDVLKVFREHSGMLLREEHISCFRCNWNNKPDNIKMISDTLNIGLDSIVFVDDSRFEIEAVKSVLPEVTCVLYNRDTVYQDLSCFNLKSDINLQTIRERTETYKTNVLREELKNTVNSFDEYLSSLEMVIDIHRTYEHELSRISELTQRTNKCSNGTRYSVEELKVKLKTPEYYLYTVCLSDKFSDLGIVGVIGIDKNVLDVFSLSCRALGRSIEQEMLKQIRQNNVKQFRFKNTGKNNDVFDILQANIKDYIINK